MTEDGSSWPLGPSEGPWDLRTGERGADAQRPALGTDLIRYLLAESNSSCIRASWSPRQSVFSVVLGFRAIPTRLLNTAIGLEVLGITAS